MKTILLVLPFLICILSASGQSGSGDTQQEKNAKQTRKRTKSKKSASAAIYIPIDLNDCFRQLDKSFDDSTRNRIKIMTESEFSSAVHFGMGMWVRNNWGLWRGSVLADYFRGMGISHPDDMSGIIFDSYHRYLTGKEIRIEEQVAYYKSYWEEAKRKHEQKVSEEFSAFHISDTVNFEYPDGYVSKQQEKLYDDDSCTAFGIVTDKDTTQWLIKVKLIDACDRRGIIAYDNEGSMIYSKKKKKLVKAKRVIEYLKPGSEKWFKYDYWITK